jgi:AraC-like DNA-binding protein
MAAIAYSIRRGASRARVPGLSARDVATYLGADGRPVEAIANLMRAHGAGDLEPDEVIPMDVIFRIFAENIALVGDEMHCVFDRPVKPGTTNLIIARMLLCPTIHEAMGAYAEAMALFVPELQVTVTRRQGGVSIRWRMSGPVAELRRIAVEGMVAVYYGIFSWIAGEILPVVRVRAPAARRGSASNLLELMGAPVVHEGDDLEVVFGPEISEFRVRESEIECWRDGAYRVLSAMTLRPLAAANGGAFTDQVRSALLDDVDQQAVARRWGVSAKTVARRLGQEGWSFRRIRDEVRMEKSSSLIHAGLTVEAIGAMLGYEDARSFRRAFRRWFGVSPSAFRTQQRAA